MNLREWIERVDAHVPRWVNWICLLLSMALVAWQVDRNYHVFGIFR